ncbi:MAG: sporulation protein YqfD [Firmicutes bacterium]|nr:sporulation protein YqfD [Bacillota bacterium]
MENNKKLPLLKSIIKIEISGLNQMRIINLLNKEGVILLDIIKHSPKLLSITINKKDSIKTFALLKNMCYTYEVVALSGPKNIRKKALLHIGLIVGIFVFSALAIFLSTMVWRIDISGNENVDALLIARHLNNQGIKSGVFRAGIDIEGAIDALRDLDGISEGTIHIRGTTVFVNVLEEEIFVDPEVPLLPSDLTSNFDAQVTRIITESGTPLVKIGDIVARDEVLISRVIFDLEGEVLEEVKARGRVYGNVAFSTTHIFSTTEVYVHDTGERKNFNSLSIFGLNIGRRTSDQVSGWQRVSTQNQFFFIPIKVNRNSYSQIIMKERQRDVNAHVDQLIRAAVLDNIIRVGGSEIETIHTLENMGNGLLMLNIHIVGEILLARVD